MGREWTEPLLLAANAIDSADLALLPGVFHVLERGFHASPAQLAGLVLAQSWLKGLAYPLWGYVAVAFYTTMHWTASADRELFLESRATQEQQLQEDHHDGSRAEQQQVRKQGGEEEESAPGLRDSHAVSEEHRRLLFF
jgi:hypothetical protein